MQEEKIIVDSATIWKMMENKVNHIFHIVWITLHRVNHTINNTAANFNIKKSKKGGGRVKSWN